MNMELQAFIEQYIKENDSSRRSELAEKAKIEYKKQLNKEGFVNEAEKQYFADMQRANDEAMTKMESSTQYLANVAGDIIEQHNSLNEDKLDKIIKLLSPIAESLSRKTVRESLTESSDDLGLDLDQVANNALDTDNDSLHDSKQFAAAIVLQFLDEDLMIAIQNELETEFDLRGYTYPEFQEFLKNLKPWFIKYSCEWLENLVKPLTISYDSEPTKLSESEVAEILARYN